MQGVEECVVKKGWAATVRLESNDIQNSSLSEYPISASSGKLVNAVSETRNAMLFLIVLNIYINNINVDNGSMSILHVQSRSQRSKPQHHAIESGVGSEGTSKFLVKKSFVAGPLSQRLCSYHNKATVRKGPATSGSVYRNILASSSSSSMCDEKGLRRVRFLLSGDGT